MSPYGHGSAVWKGSIAPDVLAGSGTWLNVMQCSIRTWLFDNKQSSHLVKTESIIFRSARQMASWLEWVTNWHKETRLPTLVPSRRQIFQVIMYIGQEGNQKGKKRTSFLYRVSSLVNKNTWKTLRSPSMFIWLWLHLLVPQERKESQLFNQN